MKMPTSKSFVRGYREIFEDDGVSLHREQERIEGEVLRLECVDDSCRR